MKHPGSRLKASLWNWPNPCFTFLLKLLIIIRIISIDYIISRFLSPSGTLGHLPKWAVDDNFPFSMYSALCLSRCTHVTHFLFHFNIINISDVRGINGNWFSKASKSRTMNVTKVKKETKETEREKKALWRKEFRSKQYQCSLSSFLLYYYEQMEKMFAQDGH